MSTEWTEETIREHLFTEVEVRDRDDESPWRRATLRGFLSLDKTDHVFVVGTGHGFEYMRLIPKPKIAKIESAWQDAELRADKNLKRVKELEATLKTLAAQAMYALKKGDWKNEAL